MTTIVMTGATLGIGKIAAKRLRLLKNTRLIVGARGRKSAAKDFIELDLASLASVRQFAAAVEKEIGAGKIDALILNAGTQFADTDHRTVDGFETTFAVNHLAHYLLLRLLQPRLAQGATVVLTTSGTHDPANKAIVPAPRHANAELLAHPDRDPDRDQSPTVAGGRAYSSSKLCNILTARALAASADAEAKGLTVVAYNPGLTPGTGLVRNASLPIRLISRLPISVLRIFLPRANAPADAGRALADVSTGAERPPAGRIYATLRRKRIVWGDPSELARRDDAMEALWRDSAGLVGLPA